MSNFNRANMDPERREHFVYRAFDAAGDLLYVGCTMRPNLRAQEHRGQSKWFHLAASFKMSGPYNYETGRRIEREAIQTESPLFNHNEPKRLRLRALRNRISNRWFNFEYAIQGYPTNWHPAHVASMSRLARVMPFSAEDGRFVSEEEVAQATEIERRDQYEFNARVRLAQQAAA